MSGASRSGRVPGARVGPYRLERRLGSGATGTVYLARDANDGAVALKVFHRHLWSRPDDEERWRHEAQLGLRLTSPRLARTLDYGVAPTPDGPLRYVAMEYVDGASLRALLLDRGAQPEASCVQVGRDVAGALAALHDARILHGDVKPENILLDKNHAARLVDLGFASLPAVRGADAGRAPLGTLRYASPERLRLGTVAAPDGRSDLYALGVVLYEMAAGAHPFAGREGAALVEAHLSDAPPDLRARGLPLSEGFVATVERLLAKDPERRFPDASAVVAALAQGQPADATLQRGSPADAGRPRRRGTKLHGRDAALRQVRELTEALAQGTGRAVLVEGPAGIGKTRLLEELLGGLAERMPTLRVLRGAYYPLGDAQDAFTPYRAAIRAEGEGRGAGEEVLGHVRSATAAARLAAPLFSRDPVSGDRAAPSAAGLTEQSLESVLIEVLASLGDASPTVLVLEDAHLGPPGWGALFSRLAAALATRRVLLVATCRPATKDAALPAAPVGAAVVRLTLEPLTPTDVRALAAEWLDTTHVPEPLEVALVRASEGVPYVCLELLRDLQDRGVLRRRADGAWSTTELGEAPAVPVALRTVLTSRLGSLARGHRDVLDVLACSPSPLAARVVAEVLGAPELAVERRLDEMERGGHLVRKPAGHAFAHHLLEQAVTEALPGPLAAAIHDGLADALAREHAGGGGDPQDVEADLCWHLLRGRQPARAAARLEPVLRDLRARLEPRRALALALRALAAGGVLVGSTRARVLVVASELARLVGSGDEALRLAEEAVATARGTGTSHELLDALAQHTALLLASGATEAARASAEERRAQALASADSSRAASAMADLGTLAAWGGKPLDALRILDEGLACLAESPEPRVERRLRRQRSVVLRRLGRTDAAIAEARLVLESARREGAPEDRVQAQSELLWLLMAKYLVTESAALLEATLDEARRIGSRQAVAHLHNAGAWIQLLKGDFAAARREAERCLALERELEIPRLRGPTLHVLSLAVRQEGHLARAVEVGARARDAAVAAGDVRLRATVAATNGATALLLARFDEAERELTEGLELLRDGQVPGVVLDLRINLAGVAEDRGLTGRAFDAYAECIRLAREWEVSEERVAEAHCRMALILAASGNTREAVSHARTARNCTADMEAVEHRLLPLVTLAFLGDVPVAPVQQLVAELGQRVGVAIRMHLEHLLWRASGDERHAAAAAALLAHLCEHAPSEDRAHMTEDVELHRAIREAGGAPAPRAASTSAPSSGADPSSS